MNGVRTDIGLAIFTTYSNKNYEHTYELFVTNIIFYSTLVHYKYSTGCTTPTVQIGC